MMKRGKNIILHQHKLESFTTHTRIDHILLFIVVNFVEFIIGNCIKYIGYLYRFILQLWHVAAIEFLNVSF